MTQNHLNLLIMTATIKSTKTVMMAMVITRFVAILQKKNNVSLFMLASDKGKPPYGGCNPVEWAVTSEPCLSTS